MDKSCDLNDGDRYTHPEDFGPQEGSVYMDTSLKHKKVGGYIGLLTILIIIIIVMIVYSTFFLKYTEFQGGS